MVKFLLYLWQFPQTLLALVIIALLRLRVGKQWEYVRVFLPEGTSTCFSLGEFIFAAEHVSETTLRHEAGHSRQSRYLGWLYLLAVGIPSAALFLYRKAFKKDDDWYHSHYPENWADKLGGVKR